MNTYQILWTCISQLSGTYIKNLHFLFNKKKLFFIGTRNDFCIVGGLIKHKSSYAQTPKNYPMRGSNLQHITQQSIIQEQRQLCPKIYWFPKECLHDVLNTLFPFVAVRSGGFWWDPVARFLTNPSTSRLHSTGPSSQTWGKPLQLNTGY